MFQWYILVLDGQNMFCTRVLDYLNCFINLGAHQL